MDDRFEKQKARVSLKQAKDAYREKTEEKRAEKVFKAVMVDCFPELRKCTNPYIPEIEGWPSGFLVKRWLGSGSSEQ